ncbi:MAG: TlpA disulfide reductase family protein [Gammaproteobacteria bacterium]
MNKKRYGLWAGFIVLCFVLGGGLYWGYYASHQSKKPAVRKPLSMLNQPRPDFTLSDIRNKPHDIRQWDGKVILLNFWATWCPPCRHEIPGFIRMYKKFKDKGFVIVGVALDTRQNAIDFLDPMGINYPVLVGEKQGLDLTQQYGNAMGVLPYSVIIDRKGIIRDTVAHAMTEKQAEQLIQPLL